MWEDETLRICGGGHYGGTMDGLMEMSWKRKELLAGSHAPAAWTNHLGAFQVPCLSSQAKHIIS